MPTIIKESSLEEGYLNVHPNPNKGHFKLQTNLQNIIKVRVISQAGAVVYEKSLRFNAHIFKLEGNDISQNIDLQLSSGIYFIEVQTEKERLVKKVVVGR